MSIFWENLLHLDQWSKSPILLGIFKLNIFVFSRTKLVLLVSIKSAAKLSAQSILILL